MHTQLDLPQSLSFDESLQYWHDLLLVENPRTMKHDTSTWIILCGAKQLWWGFSTPRCACAHPCKNRHTDLNRLLKSPLEIKLGRCSDFSIVFHVHMYQPVTAVICCHRSAESNPRKFKVADPRFVSHMLCSSSRQEQSYQLQSQGNKRSTTTHSTWRPVEERWFLREWWYSLGSNHHQWEITSPLLR